MRCSAACSWQRLQNFGCCLQVEMCNILGDIEIAQSMLGQREESEQEEEQEQVLTGVYCL